MRSRSLLQAFVPLPFVAVLASCDKEGATAPLTELTLRQELTYSVPPGQQGELDLTVLFDAQATVTALLAEKGFSFDHLRDVRIADARAVMIEPVNARFNGMARAQIGFDRPDGSALSFARIDPIPAEQSILELSVEHTDLTSYFQNGPQQVHALLDMDSRIEGDTARVRFALEFRVKAGE